MNKHTFIKHLKIILSILILITSIKSFSQTFKWVKELPFEILAQTTDKYDNVYVSGWFTDTIIIEGNLIVNPNYPNSIIIKYDSSGTLLWYKHIKSENENFCMDIKTDNSNDLILTMSYIPPLVINGDSLFFITGNHNTAIIKLNSDGDILWAMTPGYNANNCFHTYISAIDPNNNFWILGNFYYGIVTFPDTVIDCFGKSYNYFAKYNKDGNYKWVSFNDSTSIWYMASDNSGNLILYSQKYLKASSYAITKVSSNGDTLWNIGTLPGVNNYEEFLTIDNNDNIYRFFNFSDTLINYSDTLVSVGKSDIALMKYDSAGNFIWNRTAGGPSFDYVRDICSNKDFIFISGSYSNKIYFQGDSLVGTASYIAGYDTDGNVKFLKRVSGKYSFSLNRMSAYNSLYITGFAYDSAYFDSLTIVGDCSFLARLSLPQETITVPDYNTPWLFPNPFSENVTIVTGITPETAKIEVYTIQGIRVAEYNTFGTYLTLNLSHLSSGIYLFRITTDNDRRYIKGLKQ